MEENNSRLIKLFEGIPTGCVSDAMDQMGVPCGVLNDGPKMLGPDLPPMVGFAFTIQQMPKRQLDPGSTAQLKVYDTEAVEGEVVVIDAGGRTDVATTGGLLALRAKIRGIRGIVLNGCCRDADEILRMGMPFFCTGTSPRKSVSIETVGVNVPVTVGGVQIRPGDLLVGDLSGIVVVPVEKAAEIAKRARFIMETETVMEELVRKGEGYAGLRKRAEQIAGGRLG